MENEQNVNHIISYQEMHIVNPTQEDYDYLDQIQHDREHNEYCYVTEADQAAYDARKEKREILADYGAYSVCYTAYQDFTVKKMLDYYLLSLNYEIHIKFDAVELSGVNLLEFYRAGVSLASIAAHESYIAQVAIAVDSEDFTIGQQYPR